MSSWLGCLEVLGVRRSLSHSLRVLSDVTTKSERELAKRSADRSGGDRFCGCVPGPRERFHIALMRAVKLVPLGFAVSSNGENRETSSVAAQKKKQLRTRRHPEKCIKVVMCYKMRESGLVINYSDSEHFMY